MICSISPMVLSLFKLSSCLLMLGEVKFVLTNKSVAPYRCGLASNYFIGFDILVMD